MLRYSVPLSFQVFKKRFCKCLAIEISHGAKSKLDRRTRFCNFCKNLSLLNRSVLNCVLILVSPAYFCV